MAKKRPEISWRIKHKPSKDPKFQKVERGAGDGRRINEEETIFNNGWFLVIDINCEGNSLLNLQFKAFISHDTNLLKQL